MSFTVNIGEAQARLPALVRQDAFTICRRGKPVGVFLSAERLAALAETLELMAEPEFQTALRRLERGETPSMTLAEAETFWARGAPRPDRKARRRVHQQPAA